MPRLKILIATALLLPLLGCSEAKPPRSQAWAEATGAEAYERLWWKAIQDHDVPNIERHLAPIYTLTTPAGIADREQAVRHFQTLDLTSIELGELQVKPEGADMVVSYVATMQTKSSTAAQRYYMTTVWQQAKSGWIAIAHNEVSAQSGVQ
jgi:hypothetical protein